MAGVRRGRLEGDDLPGPRAVEHALRALPLRLGHEQRFAIRAAEGAREAHAVEIERLENLAALAHPYARLRRRSPDGALGIHADPVRTALELRPHASVRQAAVVGDVVRRQPGGERLA